MWSEWPRRRRRAQAYVCTAALVKICRPSVREHLFNDVAPAPAPKHGLPVLVAHILQETRGLGPCLQPPGVFFSASSSLLIPILPAPALAPQKPDVLEELAFETTLISESAICSTLTPMSSMLCPCQTLPITLCTFFPTQPHAVCQVPNDSRWQCAGLFQGLQICGIPVNITISHAHNRHH